MIELPDQYDSLDVFVVGGWIRDQLRGEESEDIDLMVAGVSADELRERGFSPVPNETFPVFHDDLGREVAMAREERSSGLGHTDFETNTVDPDVPVEEAVERDLARRDFTINSIAFNPRDGQLYDPFNGNSDIGMGVIRHTTDAFTEDPLRILRGARFASRFGYDIARETIEEAQSFTSQIDLLSGDRLRLELTKTFEQSPEPSSFFDHLREMHALGKAYPEVTALRGVPAGPRQYHSEGDSYDHTMMVLEEMQKLRPNDVDALLAALVHDFGKATTPEETLPGHSGHGKRGAEITEAFADRLNFSNDRRRIMRDAAIRHMAMNSIEEMKLSSVYDMVTELHIDRETLIDLSRADSRGRTPGSSFDADAARERFSDADRALDWTAHDTMKFRDLSEDDIGVEIAGDRFGELLRMDRIEYAMGKR